MSETVDFQRSRRERSVTAKRLAALALSASLLPLTAPAFAEVAADESAESAQDMIIVTGSRISRRDFVSESPITTVSADVVANTGQLTLEKSLGQLPQFGLGDNATKTGYGSTGQATLNMRSLGSYRNLVLLDGRRLQPSDAQQVVDLNTIPSALIESVEVITGGASAVYGSDAVAGVVNIKTKTDFEGIQLDAYQSLAGEGDGSNTELSATLGTKFADGRGRVVVSGSWAKRGTIDFNSRAFYRKHQGGTDLRLPTGTYVANGNPASQAALDAVFGAYGVAPGSVTGNSGLSFNADGSLFSASNGVYNYGGSQGGLLLNTGRQVNNPNVFLTLQAPMERYTGFGRAEFDLTDDVTLFSQVNYAKYDTTILVESGNTSLNIRADNPFIPADLRTLLASRANPDANLTLEKRFYEAGPRVTERQFEVYQVLGGARGALNAIDGTWEIYASHGRTEINETSPGSVLRSSLNALTSAADGGQSICQGGYNPFGVTALSDDCYAYLVAAPTKDTILKQDVVEANVQGHLFNLPAGEARFAAGAGWRRNSYSTSPDAILQAGDVVGVPYTGSSRGSSNVKELYVEALLPVLAGLPLVQQLDLSVGYRFSDYNLAGSVHTYKADGNWAVTDSFRIRGGYARAVRAPSVGELFVAPSGSTPTLGRPDQGMGDYCSTANPVRTGSNADAVRALCLSQGVPTAVVDNFVNLQDDADATSVGNTDLKPETADTFTVGFTFNPRFESAWLSNVALSVDFYDIRVKDAIGVVSSQNSVQKCFNVDGSNPGFDPNNFFCQNISRDANTGRISNVAQPTLNLGGYKTRGVDFQFDWRIGLDAVGFSADKTLSLNTVITYLDKFEIQTVPGARWYDYAGTVGSVSASNPGSLPKWKAVTSLAYSEELFTLGLRWRYLDGMKAVATVTNPNATTPGVGSYNLFDLYATVDLGEQYKLRFGVNNLLDKAPPVLNGVPGTTEASTYDVIGRSFYAGASVRF